MDPWQEITLGERFMKTWNDCIVGQRRRRGFDMGNQVRTLVITRLGEMHFVAYPTRGALLRVVRFWIIRGINALPGSTHIRRNVSTAGISANQAGASAA